MRGVRGFGDRFPIPLESGKPVWYQSDGAREIPPITGKWVPDAWPQTYKYASNAFTWDTIPDVLERAGISDPAMAAHIQQAESAVAAN